MYLAARAAAPEGAGPTLLGAEGSRHRVYTVRAEANLESGAVFVREAVVSLVGNAQQPFTAVLPFDNLGRSEEAEATVPGTPAPGGRCS